MNPSRSLPSTGTARVNQARLQRAGQPEGPSMERTGTRQHQRCRPSVAGAVHAGAVAQSTTVWGIPAPTWSTSDLLLQSQSNDPWYEDCRQYFAAVSSRTPTHLPLLLSLATITRVPSMSENAPTPPHLISPHITSPPPTQNYRMKRTPWALCPLQREKPPALHVTC